jgi:hypothetical protein
MAQARWRLRGLCGKPDTGQTQTFIGFKKMIRERAEKLARQEMSRLIADNMGLFLIAEAWDIEPFRPAKYGSGLLTEAYVLEQMTSQIMGMSIEKEEATAAQYCYNEEDLLPLRQGSLG